LHTGGLETGFLRSGSKARTGVADASPHRDNFPFLHKNVMQTCKNNLMIARELDTSNSLSSTEGAKKAENCYKIALDFFTECVGNKIFDCLMTLDLTPKTTSLHLYYIPIALEGPA